jgi:cell division protein ZapE
MPVCPRSARSTVSAADRLATALRREVERAVGRLRVDVRGSKGFVTGFESWVAHAGVDADPQQKVAMAALEAAWAARPPHAEAVATWNAAVEALAREQEARVREREKRVAEQQNAWFGSSRKEPELCPLATPIVGPCSWLELGPRPRLPHAGVYIHGKAGSGKTTVADVALLAGPGKKRRLHFHELSLEVHQLLAQGIPAAQVADAISDGAELILIDELNVTTVGDARLLSLLMDRWSELDVTMVVTTNRGPEDLYAHGLHRASALELLTPILSRMAVVRIDTVDFREQAYEEFVRAASSSGRSEDGMLCSCSWQQLFLSETGGAEPREENVALTWGRSFKLLAVDGVAHASFLQLCAQPLSADDYLVLADTFHTLLVSGVRPLARHEHNEARRFTNLVDAAYEANVKVVLITEGEMVSLDDLLQDITLLCDRQTVEASSLKGFDEVNVLGLEDIRASRRMSHTEADPWDRYDATQSRPKGGADAQRPKAWTAAGAASSVFHPNLEEYEEAMDDGVQGVGKAALGSLQESGFAAKRAVSRLKEMQTDRYLRAHSARKLDLQGGGLGVQRVSSPLQAQAIEAY